MGIFDLFRNDNYLEEYPFETVFEIFINGLNKKFLYGYTNIRRVSRKEYVLSHTTFGFLAFTYNKDSIMIQAILPNSMNSEFTYSFYGTHGADSSKQLKMIDIFVQQTENFTL